MVAARGFTWCRAWPIRNQLQKLKCVSLNVICNEPKLSPPANNPGIKQITPKLPLVLLAARGPLGGTAPRWREGTFGQNPLRNMARYHSEKVLKPFTGLSLHEQVKVVPLNGIFIDFDLES